MKAITGKTCGNCARIGARDMGRNYCPFTASPAYFNKPADRCICHVMKGSKEAEALEIDMKAKKTIDTEDSYVC